MKIANLITISILASAVSLTVFANPYEQTQSSGDTEERTFMPMSEGMMPMMREMMPIMMNEKMPAVMAEHENVRQMMPEMMIKIMPECVDTMLPTVAQEERSAFLSQLAEKMGRAASGEGMSTEDRENLEQEIVGKIRAGFEAKLN